MASHCCCSVVRLYSLIQLLLHHGITVIMTLTFTRCFVSQRCKTGWGAGSWAQTGGGSLSTMDSDIHRAEKKTGTSLWKYIQKKQKQKNKKQKHDKWSRFMSCNTMTRGRQTHVNVRAEWGVRASSCVEVWAHRWASRPGAHRKSQPSLCLPLWIRSSVSRSKPSRWHFLHSPEMVELNCRLQWDSMADAAARKCRFPLMSAPASGPLPFLSRLFGGIWRGRLWLEM